MKKMLMVAAAAFAAQSASAAGFPSLGALGSISLGSALPSLQTFPLPVLGGFALGDVPVVGGDEFGITVSQLVATAADGGALPGSLSATFLPLITGGSSPGPVGLVSQLTGSSPYVFALISSAPIPQLAIPNLSGASLPTINSSFFALPSASTLASSLPGLALLQAILQQ